MPTFERNRLCQISGPVQTCSAFSAFGFLTVYRHKQLQYLFVVLFQSISLLLWRYTTLCCTCRENSVLKAYSNTFLPSTNLKEIWCLQKSDVLYRRFLCAAIKNWEELIGDHTSFIFFPFFFQSKNDANKASVLFFKSCRFYVQFLKVQMRWKVECSRA